MSTGYTVNGTDFDSIFKARVTTARSNVNYNVGGTDIANRYEASAGNGSPNADQISYNTNYDYNGTDLRYYFQAASYITTTTTTLAPTTTTPSPTTTTPSPTTTTTLAPTTTTTTTNPPVYTVTTTGGTIDGYTLIFATYGSVHSLNTTGTGGFLGWTASPAGNASIANASNPSTNVTIYGAVSLYAAWTGVTTTTSTTPAPPPTYTVTINTASGGSSTACFDSTYCNTTITNVAATFHLITANAATGYAFSYWSYTGGVSISNIYSATAGATISNNATITANFIAATTTTTTPAPTTTTTTTPAPTTTTTPPPGNSPIGAFDGDNSPVSLGSAVTGSGWAAYQAGSTNWYNVDSVHIFVFDSGNNLVGGFTNPFAATSGDTRTDVCPVIAGVSCGSTCPCNCGWHFSFDSTPLGTGTFTLEARAYTSNYADVVIGSQSLTVY